MKSQATNSGFGVAMISALMLCTTATNADPFWSSDHTATELKPGKFYIGAGGIGGVYQLPRWRSPISRFRNFVVPEVSISGNLVDVTKFTPNVPFAGSGGTVGYVFPTGTFPAGLGQKVRLSFSTNWSAGRTTSRSSLRLGDGVTAAFPTASVNIHSADGRVGFNGLKSVNTTLDETLYTRFSATEFGMRLASDFVVTPITRITPSLGIFGGWSTERYQFRSGFRSPTANGPMLLDEKNSSSRIGFDLGLATTFRAARNFFIGVSARAGAFWINTRMRASDCYSSAAGSSCTTAAGSFSNNGTGFSTTQNDSASTVGFRGSTSLSLTWVVFRRTSVQFGSFLTWDSAVPGVVNPTSSSSSLAVGSSVTPAHIKYDSGFSAGGFFMLRIPLN